MESMELFAKISLLAKTLGNVNNINEENVRKIIDLRSNFIKDDNGYAGCKIGDKLINSAAPSGGNNGNGNVPSGENEMITLKKSELVEIVSKIVANIIDK